MTDPKNPLPTDSSDALSVDTSEPAGPLASAVTPAVEVPPARPLRAPLPRASRLGTGSSSTTGPHPALSATGIIAPPVPVDPPELPVVSAPPVAVSEPTPRTAISDFVSFEDPPAEVVGAADVSEPPPLPIAAAIAEEAPTDDRPAEPSHDAPAALEGLEDLGDSLELTVDDLNVAESLSVEPRRELVWPVPSDRPGEPLSPNRFADIVLGDEELDAIFQDLDVGDHTEVEATAPHQEAPLENEGVSVEAESEVAIEPSSAAPPVQEDAEESPTIDGGDAELNIGDSDEEVLIDLDPSPTSDRGALLAESVTTRRRNVDVGDRLFTFDARAEAEARLGLIESEAEACVDAAQRAALLAHAADLADAALGDRARARLLADRARAADGGTVLALRVLRRICLAEGDQVGALETCVAEAGQSLSAIERTELGLLGGELAATRDPEDADRWWTDVAGGGGVTGALARLFAGALRRDTARVGEGLAAFAESTGGLIAAATDVTRARLAEGSAEKSTALLAVRDAVQRDPSDAGAWLAMARIGLDRGSAAVFRQALRGLANAGGDGAIARAAGGVGRALDAILGEPIESGVVQDAGVAGWLAAHALQDAGGDPSDQVRWAVSNSATGEGCEWRALAGTEASPSDVGRYHQLRTAVEKRGEEAFDSAASSLVRGDGLAAGLRARPGEVSPTEPKALGAEASATLVASLVAAAGLGLPDEGASGGDPYRQIAAIEALVRQGDRAEARTRFTALADASSEGDLGVVSYAGRRAAALADDDVAFVNVLRTEALLSSDPARAAALRLIAAAVAAPLDMTGGAADALEAGRALPGDLAVAEMAGLYALRADLPSEVGADLLEAAAGDGHDPARRMAAVRAALRRASTNADAAAVAIWRSWRRNDADAALGVLLLRAPAGDPERTVSVLRAQADRLHQQQGASSTAGVAVGLALAVAWMEAGRPAEAVQAIARARSTALHDADLAHEQERAWLAAGMFAEVAEKAFDQLKSAPDDGHRIAAYEKLAELDRTYRGDVASSVLSYQAILEIAPGHAATLRVLERYFLDQGRYEELLGIYDRLIRHAPDPSDAVAAAHAATRLATAHADGDPAAGVGFAREAFLRGAPDRRLLTELDADARWTGDLARFAEVHARAAEITSDEQALERAAHLCRAGEAYLALGDHPRAMAAFERAATDAPTDIVALSGLARERELTGDLPGAAAAHESLGASLRSKDLAVRAFLRAAALWDQATEPFRSLAALLQVLARDPKQSEALHLALQLFRQASDAEGELNFLESHTVAAAAVGETVGLADLHRRAAEIAEERGDRARARKQWRMIARLEPENEVALRALARLSVEAQDWTPAADAMIRLARVAADPAERVELFFALGEIFDRRLPDPRRAEAAYRRALQVAPEDPRLLSRLADLYARTGAPDREAEMLSVLVPLTKAGPDRVTLQLRLARALDEGSGDTRRAEAALEAARREAPIDLEVLRAYARFYERKGATASMHVLLDRAAAEVRRELDRKLTDLPLLGHLSDILSLRGRTDGVRLVAATAVVMGVADASLTERAPQGTVPGAEANALTPAALELLSPPAVTPALREVLARGADVLERVIPFDPKPLRAERLGVRPHPLRAEIERWARLLNLPAIEIYIAPQVPGTCLSVGRSPAAVVVPAAASLTPATRFAVTRGMLLTALALPLAVRSAPREFALAMSALLRQFEPMYRAEGVDGGQLDDLARKFARALPKERHADIAPFAYEVLAKGGIDAEAIQAGSLELGDRVALLATGDLAAALAALAPEGMSIPRAIHEVTAVGRLVRVALSDRFLEARHVSGADRPSGESRGG